MAPILHGIAQRAADGTAAAADAVDAVETGRKAAPLAELAWDCALRHQAATR
jgi:acyl-CoA dehydrogenase